MKRFASFLILSVLIAIPALAADYRMSSGDALVINVWGEQSMTGEAMIRPDGKITIPGLGEFTAAGKTPMDLKREIDASLKGLLKYSPTVTVAVKQILPSHVYVFGGGVPQAVYDLTPDTTLLHLLCSIEDVSKADFENAYLLRNNVSRIRENFLPLFESGNVGQDIPLIPGDKIFIPPLVKQHVFVVGEVEEPKAIEFRKGMTVLEAILQAGGFTTYADKNDTLIVRKKGDGQETIKVRAKDLVEKGDLSQDLALLRGDTVIVTKSLF